MGPRRGVRGEGRGRGRGRGRVSRARTVRTSPPGPGRAGRHDADRTTPGGSAFVLNRRIPGARVMWRRRKAGAAAFQVVTGRNGCVSDGEMVFGLDLLPGQLRE